ncbi:isocitrate dehydrogenase [Candidatus Hakubella thermalkaliphila]|uniref:Isocitrate dehydrogenase n=1 Tax=Candidatus Hakubella thermalkaliphila TaxID=2754717 RepID=A0A6V8PH69_9ACTN|nr:isocitrate/isopropylmalate family dehydrogenase [Candidatus Hakubella thermalkaliphila]GFP31607.1 isocitrate dehydrogenase [Candidatus Hakubella thermalkaliphila]
MAYSVTLIPGDGIGPEITKAMQRTIEATGVDVRWEVVEAGERAMAAQGTPLPDQVLASIRSNRVAIKGPITTPVGSGFRSVNVFIRKELDLYACLRPVFSIYANIHPKNLILSSAGKVISSSESLRKTETYYSSDTIRMATSVPNRAPTITSEGK